MLTSETTGRADCVRSRVLISDKAEPIVAIDKVMTNDPDVADKTRATAEAVATGRGDGDRSDPPVARSGALETAMMAMVLTKSGVYES